MANFKKITIAAESKKEAAKKAPFKVKKDVTISWKKAGSPRPGSSAFDSFLINALADETRNTPGMGITVTITPAVANTRERPFKVTHIPNKCGKREYKSAIQLRDAETNAILDTLVGYSKADAVKVVSRYYRKNKFKGNIIAEYIHVVVTDDKFAFEVKYTPSKSYRQGEYIAFGIEQF